jgi:hypothetical protein
VPRRAPAARVTWGFLSFLGVVSYRIRILMYFDVSCMYLACISMCPIKIHQDTSRYIKIHLYLSLWHDDGIETFPQPPRYVSCMYPACIPHVSRMCPACILITTEDTCIPHVSRMYPACIPHVSLHIRYISLRMQLRYSLPPPLRKHDVKKLRQAKVPWGSKKTAHG